MVDPRYLQRLEQAYATALAREGGNVERAIRLLSKRVDRVALGGTRNQPGHVVVRRALGLEASRAQV